MKEWARIWVGGGIAGRRRIIGQNTKKTTTLTTKTCKALATAAKHCEKDTAKQSVVVGP